MTSNPADALARGLARFNAGEHFAAHEAWEDRWRVSDDPDERRLLQGLIQVAAGHHKRFVQGRPESAARLLARGLAKLDACAADAGGLALAEFRGATRAWLDAGGHDPAPRLGFIVHVLKDM
jgi:predicted metal-dependent hydrolase